MSCSIIICRERPPWRSAASPRGRDLPDARNATEGVPYRLAIYDESLAGSPRPVPLPEGEGGQIGKTIELSPLGRQCRFATRDQP